MTHPASTVPILTVASALGMEVGGRAARCYNGAAHKSGTDEKPALVFQTQVNRYQCYACGVRGDAIDLVRAVRQVGFREAVEWLSTVVGTTPAPAIVPGNAYTRTPSEDAKEIYATLYELSHRLGPVSPGFSYLRRRGIDAELATEYRVTELYDPFEVWEQLKSSFGIEQLQAAGLVSQRGNFLFTRHRLLFFYFDDGWPQFLQARDMTGEASCKELSLGGGLHSPVPYNCDALKNNPERVLICEGCIDTLSAAQLGYAAVGVPGVCGFRDEWFPLFRGVGRVIIAFDNDDAGRRQGAELRSRFRLRGLKADTVIPSQGKDINDLLNALAKEKS